MLLESQDGLAGSAKAALADDGLGLVVWTYTPNASADRRVYASRELSNGDWADPVVIDDGDGDPFGPLLALQPNGNAIVAWTEVESDGGQQIYANTFDRQTGWAGPVRLSLHSHQERPSLAANDQGTAVVVWRASDIFGRSIVSNRFDPGKGWDTSEIIDPTLTFSSYPSTAVDASGNAVAAWNDDSVLAENKIYASPFSQSAGWMPAVALSDPQRGISVHALTVDSLGNFVAIWRQFEGSAFYRLISRQYSVPTGWAEPVTIGFDDGQASINDVAADKQGGVVAIGTRATGVEMSDIFAIHRSADGAWGDPILLDNEAGRARFPEIAASSDGSAIATWQQFDGEENSAYAAHYAPESGWATPQLLETTNSSDPRGFDIGSVNISMNASGDAIATWSQYDGNGYSVYINRYE